MCSAIIVNGARKAARFIGSIQETACGFGIRQGDDFIIIRRHIHVTHHFSTPTTTI